MRALEVLLVVFAVACVHDHPHDPRKHDVETFARSGLGAWARVATRDRTFEGELISVDGTKLHVFSQATGELWVFDQYAITSVEVYPVADVDPLVGMRVVGGLATLAHGAWLLLSMPAYLGITAAVINSNIDPIVRYPDQRWTDLATWARFPQGLPAGVGLDALRAQVRKPPVSSSARPQP
jgi:hypothetical protein